MEQKEQLARSFAQKFTITLVLLILLAGVFTQSVAAQSTNPPTDDEVNAIARELYCPVCENIPLDVCPTQACAQWRGLIKEKLSEGWTKDQIKDYFVAQYGDRVLAEPPRRGLNWLVYVLPPIIFLVGIFVVYQNLKKLRYKPQTDPSNQPSLESSGEEKYLSEVEAALRDLEKSE